MSPSLRPGRRPGSRRRWQILAIAASALIASGCTAAGSAPAAPASRGPGAGSGTSPAASPSPADPARGGFTVAGVIPVPSNPSQDTHARDPAAACQRQKLRRDAALGQATAAAFTSAGAPVSAMLLTHFLGGTGTAVHFGTGSEISREARASSVFRSLNSRIQAAVLSQLRAGTSHVHLTGSALRTIRFGVPASAQDLYLGFRGTQGLDVRGTGVMTSHRYTGTLTYVIRDSYGFPPRDQLLGIGTAMRYLQVNCGNPPVRAGARWFPDSITVAVPFRHPRG